MAESAVAVRVEKRGFSTSHGLAQEVSRLLKRVRTSIAPPQKRAASDASSSEDDACVDVQGRKRRFRDKVERRVARKLDALAGDDDAGRLLEMRSQEKVQETIDKVETVLQPVLEHFEAQLHGCDADRPLEQQLIALSQRVEELEQKLQTVGDDLEEERARRREFQGKAFQERLEKEHIFQMWNDDLARSRSCPSYPSSGPFVPSFVY